jgi:tetratricopeptide (TPR) repeat protein
MGRAWVATRRSGSAAWLARASPWQWKYDSERIDFSLERTLTAPFVETAYIVYDSRDSDRRHVELFRRRTSIIEVPLPDAGHPATGSLAEAGLLGDLVLDFVADRLDVGDIVRRMSLERETPQFYFVMSQRASSARARIAYAGAAAAMAPNNFGLIAHYASLLAVGGRFAEAQIAFARAAALFPDSPFLLYKLAEFHERRGDLERAIEAAELLVSLHSGTFQPRLERLRALQERATHRIRWPTLSIRGKRIIGNWALPIDVRVTTTPSPPPFVESWRRHEALMARRPEGPIDVFLVGDSLVEYWPDEMWAALRVFNFGVKADKTQHAIWRLEQLPAGAIDCDHAVILIGTNNLGADDTAGGIAAGIAAVIAAVVRVAPRATIHAVGVPPCGAGFQFRSDVRRKANQALARLEGFETLDVDAALTAPDCACFKADGIHLAEAGYVLLTDLVRRRLKGARGG